VYRKLMMLLIAVAVLGLAIGLVGCPEKQLPTPVGPLPDIGVAPGPGSELPPPPPVEEEEVEEEVVEEVEEEAPGE
jgi:hypothetical protein